MVPEKRPSGRSSVVSSVLLEAMLLLASVDAEPLLLTLDDIANSMTLVVVVNSADESSVIGFCVLLRVESEF